MEMQVYKVRDPSGNIREIRGPAGASDADIVAQAKRLFAEDEPFVGKSVQPDLGPLRPAPALPRPEPLPGPRQPSFGDYVREAITPTVETGGAILGGAAGAFLGPAGAIGGAGLGYGIARQGLRLFDELRGAQPVQPPVEALITGAKDVATGALLEGYGRVAGDLLTRSLGALKNLPFERARTILTDTLARDRVSIDDVTRALQTAPKNLSAGEALANAGINAPTTQALLERGLAREPSFMGRLAGERTDEVTNALTRLAGGPTQTAARATQEQAIRNLNMLTEPAKQTALARANLGAGQVRMGQTAAQAREQAASAVEGVRRFGAAAEQAAPRVQGEISTARFPGQPRTPFRASYMRDLAERADDVMDALAKESLDAGTVARSNESAVRALEAFGLKPLTPAPVIEKLRAQARNPEIAGNNTLETAFKKVEDVLLKWTDANGIIDARAMDSIRKNVVNDIAEELSKGDPTTKQKVARNLTASLSPAITEAIEAAGGKGYGEYLAYYAKARQAINQKELGSVALDLLKNNKKGFIELVEGNSPETVEKIFGPGSYNIAKELSGDILASMKGLTTAERASMTAASQASVGGEALREILKDNLPRYKLPPYFSAKITTINNALEKLENKIGTSTMKIITNAAKTGGDLDGLLRSVPSSERARLEKLFNQLRMWIQPTATGAAVTAGPEIAEGVQETVRREVNHLRSQEQRNQNALAR